MSQRLEPILRPLITRTQVLAMTVAKRVVIEVVLNGRDVSYEQYEEPIWKARKPSTNCVAIIHTHSMVSVGAKDVPPHGDDLYEYLKLFFRLQNKMPLYYMVSATRVWRIVDLTLDLKKALFRYTGALPDDVARLNHVSWLQKVDTRGDALAQCLVSGKCTIPQYLVLAQKILNEPSDNSGRMFGYIIRAEDLPSPHWALESARQSHLKKLFHG